MEGVDTNTVNGKLMLDLMGSISEHELETIKARMKA